MKASELAEILLRDPDKVVRVYDPEVEDLVPVFGVSHDDVGLVVWADGEEVFVDDAPEEENEDGTSRN